MPKQPRFKTQYVGVFYIMGTSEQGKPEKIFYIQYRKPGAKNPTEEKAGRQFKDAMTAAQANQIRSLRIKGKQESNQERRDRLEAERAAEKAKLEIWTINRLWEEYKRQHELKGLAQDESRYTNHLKNDFGDKEPATLVPLDFDRLRVRLLKAKSPQTVKNVMALLRRIIYFGAKKGLCDKPAFEIQMPTGINNEKTEDLSDQEIARLLEALENNPDQQAADIVRIALFTGMRRGEIFKLKWDDVDFEHGNIHIRDPKGGKDAVIPLNADARRVLEAHPHQEGSPFVFPGRGGKQRVEARKSVNRIKKAAGLPADFRPMHGLRHTFASMLVSSGQVDLYTVSKLLTHKSPQMTQRYAHLRDESRRKAAELVGCCIAERVQNGQEKAEGTIIEEPAS